jgi:hypothetical protein
MSGFSHIPFSAIQDKGMDGWDKRSGMTKEDLCQTEFLKM